MKLLHLKDQTEKHGVKAIDGLTISVKLYDIQKQGSDLQNLVQEVAKDDFEGIVVSTKLGDTSDYWGLEFCMRLRLSYSLIGVKAFTTLFVYTESPVEEIMKEQTEHKTEPTATLLLTKGTFAFDSFDFFTVISTPPSNYNQLNEGNYKTAFLDVIKINRPPKTGHHSLANLLGATRLAKITGNRDVLDTNAAICEKKTDLYFKFKTDFKNSASGDFPKKIIRANGKHILLIDDKENFGWSDVLRQVFKDAFFDFVEAGENFVERAEKKASEKDEKTSLPKWDLILLDLRLEEIEDSDELVHKQASEYSGGKLLQKLKETNRGIQIIVFTASNKAWNYRELYDLGADGYFVKESPELTLTDEFSEQNLEVFFKQVACCFQYSFLKSFYFILKSVDAILTPRTRTTNAFPLPKDFVSEYLKWIRLGNDNLAANKNELGLTTSFILYFSVLENIANRIIDTDTPFQNGNTADGKQLFYFEFRTAVKKLVYFEEVPRYSGNYLRTLKTSFPRSIPWQQKILNTFDFLSNYNLDMTKINQLLKKRNEIVHPNPTTGRKIKVEKEDVISIFNLITDNIKGIK